MFSKSKSLLLAVFALLTFCAVFVATNQQQAKADPKGACGQSIGSNLGAYNNPYQIDCDSVNPNLGGGDANDYWFFNPDSSAVLNNFIVFNRKGTNFVMMVPTTGADAFTAFCFVPPDSVKQGFVFQFDANDGYCGNLSNFSTNGLMSNNNGTGFCSIVNFKNGCDYFSGNDGPWPSNPAKKYTGNGRDISKQIEDAKAADAKKNAPDPCQSENQAGPLGFLLCPLFRLVQTSINSITGVGTCTLNTTTQLPECTINTDAPLMSLLIVKPLEFSGQGNNAYAGASVPLQAANERVRDIAYALYMIIFLVIIFANFIDFGIDNYTIKRLLPRLVAAIVLTPFSYLICAFAIDVGNTLGFAVPVIITGGNAPTNPIESALKAVAQLGAGNDVLSGLAVLGSFLIILALAIAVLISLIVALIYMLFRLLFLYLLVIVAPIAIAASVLPLTNKFFRMWGTNLIKLNLMFPLVTGLIAISGVVSGVLLSSAGSNNFMKVAAALVPVLAFFLIPKCFKWSGELMEATAGAAAAYLGGRAGSYAKSANQAHNEKEAERRQARRQEIAAGRNRLYGGENSLARRVRAGSGIRKNKPANMVDFRAKQMAALKPWMDAAKLADNKQLEKMGSSRNPMAQRAAGEAMLNRGMAKEFLNSKANTAANIDFIKRLNPDAFKKMPMIADQKWRDNKGTDRNDWYGKLTFDKIADMSADAQQHVLIDNWSKLSPTVQAAAADRRNQGRLDPLAGAAAQAGGTAPAGYNPTNNPFNSL